MLRWLDSPGIRLVEVDGSWSCPAHGAGGQRLLLDLAIELESDPDPFADRRGLGRCSARLARASLPRVSVPRSRVDCVITAIVLVKTAVDRVPDVAQAIAEFAAVTEVYSVTGEFDLVAMVRVRQHDELAEVIPGGLNKVDGVLATETHIAFRTYSRHDLESAFSLGLGDN